MALRVFGEILDFFLRTSRLPPRAGVIWIVIGNSQNSPQGGLSYFQLVSDILQRNLDLPELKGNPLFLLGKGFAGGLVYHVHGGKKLDICNLVRLLILAVKTKVFHLG
jgi:hypothetical protein